jgi:hypothetical protein
MKPPKERIVYIDLKNKERDAVVLWDDLDDAVQELNTGESVVLGVYVFQKFVKVIKKSILEIKEI